MKAADGPDLWRIEPDGVLAVELRDFRLVAWLVDGTACFLALQRSGPAGMLPPTAVVASGTRDSVWDAMAAAGEMAARLAAGTRRFDGALQASAPTGVPPLGGHRLDECYASAPDTSDAGWCEEWAPIRPTASADETYGDFLRAIEKGHYEPELIGHLAKCDAALPDLHRRILGLAEHSTCADAVRVLRTGLPSSGGQG